MSETLLICSDQGRANLLARAERSLPVGEVIVQVKDLIGRRRAFRTLPVSPRAELVASEPALVLRGGLTLLISYYRVPADELAAVESHAECDVHTHDYQVQLRVACHGQAVKRALVA